MRTSRTLASLTVALGGTAATAALVVLGPTGADAARMMTGKDIKNDSITSKDVRDGSLQVDDFAPGALTGPAGAPGATGPAGATGATGAAGAPGRSGTDGTDGTDGLDGAAGAGSDTVVAFESTYAAAGETDATIVSTQTIPARSLVTGISAEASDESAECPGGLAATATVDGTGDASVVDYYQSGPGPGDVYGGQVVTGDVASPMRVTLTCSDADGEPIDVPDLTVTVTFAHRALGAATVTW